MQKICNIACIILTLILFQNCKVSTTSPGDTNLNSKGKGPKGYIYFLTASPKSIIKYNIFDSTFTQINNENDLPLDLSVSQDGGFLAFSQSDCTIAVLNIGTNNWRYYKVKVPIDDRITMSSDGMAVAFVSESQGASSINILYTDNGNTSSYTLVEVQSCKNLLFSKSIIELAWTQNNGVYLGQLPLNQTNIEQVTDEYLLVQDFSPSGKYLCAGSKIFNLFNLSETIYIFSGQIQFTDDSHVLYVPDVNKKLILSNLSGNEEYYLTDMLYINIEFCVSPNGRYASHVLKEGNKLHFYVHDLQIKKEVAQAFYSGNFGTSLKYIFWRDLPFSSSK